MVQLDELGPEQLDRIAQAPKVFLERVRKVKSKRARFVIDEIMKNGYCTTATIQGAGYDHPPRAARDVRECGIPLVTERYDDPDGKRLGVYFFGDFNYDPMASKSSGRSVLTNSLKQRLIDRFRSRCFIFLEDLPADKLQVDHRVPYEIAGEQDENNLDNFMLLSASANRRKSWECEHCPNWTKKDSSICSTCFWAHPESYSHVACQPYRQISFSIDNPDAIASFDSISKRKGSKWLTAALKERVEHFLSESNE